MSSSEIEELKKQLALFQAAAPDIADKVREYEEQQRIEREEKEERERYEKIINNIPKAIEYIKNGVIGGGEVERGELIKEVLELAFEKIKNQEERIQDLEETIYEMDNPDEFKFEPYCNQKHRFSIIQSKLEPGEYIIKEIYNLNFSSDNMYITNFGNLLSMNTSHLREDINYIGRFISGLIGNKNTYHNIFQYLHLQPYYNEEQDKKNLYPKLFGGEIQCCCYHFNSTFEEGDCGYKGKKFEDFNYSCSNPFYKAVCNKNTIMEPFLVEAIKNYKFDVKIPINLNHNYNKDTEQFIPFNQKYGSPNGEKLIQFFEENTFGGFLKDKIINFIEEVRRSNPRMNYINVPLSQPPIAEPVLGIPETPSVSSEVLKNAAEQRRDNIRNRVIRRKKYESKSGGSSGNLLRWNIG